MKRKVVTKYAKGRLREGLSIVLPFWNVTKEEVLGTSRSRKIINARHSLRYYLCMSNDLCLADIGALTNGDHSSVIHSRTAFENFCEYEEDFRAIKRIMRGEIAHQREVNVRVRLGEILRSGRSIEKKTNLIMEYYGNK